MASMVKISNASLMNLQYDAENRVLHAFSRYQEGPRSFCPWCAFEGGQTEEILPILGVAFAFGAEEVHIHLLDREDKVPLFEEIREYRGEEPFTSVNSDWKGDRQGVSIPRVKWVGGQG